MGVGSGTTLLVNGAGAMVGFAAVQIALRRGARVIAAAGSVFAAELTALGALVTPYGEGLAERVRDLAKGPVDLVLDAAPPNAGSIPELIAIAGEPHRVMTISNHDEARQHGARRFCRNTPHLRPTAHSASRSLIPTRSVNGGRPSR
jgi:NADPH:quinone reductase-like Zn-dependent oxidoreductase